MTARRIRTELTDQIEPHDWLELTELCAEAFGEDANEVWGSIGPGVHVIADVRGRIVAHAMIVDRELHVGTEAAVTVDVGYVENVATRADARDAGHATAVMETVGSILHEEYSLGALATGSQPFYERLGWERWAGPTFVRMPDGERVRSADEDGHVMVLRTARTPALDLAQPVSVSWRPREPW